MLTKAVRGTKDVLPDQTYKWQYVERVYADVCKRYGFCEIRTPSFEHTELFLRSVGDTTDIVEKQMYTFEDFGKRSLTLKPEGTSPVVRAFIENKLYAEVQPTKLWYQIPCFRYEKPQSGRLREFHQFGTEIFGTDNMMADAEVISLAVDFLNALGIDNLELKINSIGCPVCRTEYRELLKNFLAPVKEQLCETCQNRYERNPMRILDCKSPVCQELVHGAPVMLDHICEECSTAFQDLKSNLDASQVQYTVDPGIVRGLDYYTKTAFEIVTDTIGAQGTVCGGGRYDNLIEEIGGPPIPGVGFGLGVERLLLVMENNDIPIPQDDEIDVFLAVMGEKAKEYGLSLLHELRKHGFRAQMDIMSRNLKNQFKYADRLHAGTTIVIGDNELAERTVTWKNMKTSEQRQLPFDQIIVELQKQGRQ